MRETLNRISRMLDIPGLDPQDARRRKLLNVMLLALATSAVIMLPVLLIAVPLGIAGEQSEAMWLGLGAVIALLGAGITYALNRYVSGELASTLFLLLLIVIATSFDEPQHVVNGRSLLIFTLPILAASVLLRPWASFVAAFACALAIVVIGLFVIQQSMVNVPAILILFMLALVSWLSARSLEHAMEDLRAGNKLLQESEKRFQSYVENAPNGIFVTDEKGNHVEVNKAAESITGYSRSELLKMNLIKLVGTGDHPKVKEHLNMVAKTGKASGDFASIKKDGSLNYWAVNAVKLVETRFLGFATDITERVQSETEREQLLTQVQTQANLMRGIMDTVPEGVLLLNANGRIVLANPVAGQALAILTGRDDTSAHESLTHLGDRPLAELLTSPPKGLWHEVKASGRTFEAIARPMELAADGRSGNWVLVIRDVTQEREIERRSQQQDRLAAVGQLAAGVAHDFNNIMATIVLYTKMSLSVPDLSPKIRQRLETVSGQAYRATDLVQQILDFSRRAVLERRPMDLTPFLKEVVKLLERTVPENIKIGLSYSSDEYTVNADPTRMQQAIINLVVNARDAMPEGGEIDIELERVQIESHQEPPLPEMEAGEWVRVRVADTGSGVPPDVLPHIFEPFFTTKAVGKGTGLGLAQVHGIVTQHEGHVGVSSEVGAGTMFTLYLPVLLTSLPKASAPKPEVLVQGQGETILVVEDDTILRKALTGILEQLNYRVLKAADGREALSTLEQHAGEISLVLSDLVMPEMGGQALFHALQQRGLALPVVMLSGHPMQTELEDLQAQGLAGWMLKPPNMEQLSRLLARVLKDHADADAQKKK